MTFSTAPRQPPIVAPPIRLAVCVSGGGTTLQSLIDRIGDRRLEAELVQVVASKPGIGAIERARAAGIPVAIEPRGGRSLGEFSEAVFAAIRGSGADLVILGGFLSLIEIPEDYHLKVINIHPSLLPAFGGQGFHGARVHRAVIESGAQISGCTVHFADATFDTGPIILQRSTPVLADDTPASLAARVFELECEALAEAITLYASGRLRMEGRRVRVV